jgi:K+-transporting ATPase ATPase A chain
MFVIIAVFLAGLMVGRTPEYLGKKIEKREVQLAMIGVLTPSALILIFSAIAVQLEAGLAPRANLGPHGLSEILYAFTSASANNGSAFAGLGAGADFYTITQSVCMALGRLAAILPPIAIGASMAQKKAVPPGPGSFAVDNFTFAFLLIAVILIVGGLTFFPALLLGPGLEALLANP